MSYKSMLIDQFNACYNDKSWFIPLHEIFMDINVTKEIPSYFNAPWWGVVSNLSIHNAYHIGQIMLLKKHLVSIGL